MNLNLPLAPDRYYHIYNRGINRENLFKEDRNYTFFLQKYAQYLSPVVDTFAYCLLRNHFHFLIRIKGEDSIREFYNTRITARKISEGLHSAEFIVSKQFARFFSSYTQSMNKVYQRTGALIEAPFKRIEIDNDAYLTHLISYIHCNPQKHGFVSDFKVYPYSSFKGHLNQSEFFLNSKEVFEWFGGIYEFIEFHLRMPDVDSFKGLVLE